jgi:hypothetical protein
VALQCVLTCLQQNKPVAVLLHRNSNIAFAPNPIGTIVLNAVEKAGGLFRGGNQLTEIIEIKHTAITYICTFESANICVRRTQIFELSSLSHFSMRMVLTPPLDVFWITCRLVFSPDISPPFLQTITSRASLAG